MNSHLSPRAMARQKDDGIPGAANNTGNDAWLFENEIAKGPA
jgi:hypothetical protein